MKASAGIGALAFALPAYAGMSPDPRPGDNALGKVGGVAYVSDSDFFASADSSDTGAACPDTPGKWRITAGGFGITGGADSSHTLSASVPADLLDVYGDDDLIIDDYWRVFASVSVGSTVTSYAICTKWRVKQKRIDVPDSDSGERTHVAKCARGKVSGGGGSISSSNSYVSSMFPKKGKRWKFAAFDGVGGVGGMDNYVICTRGGPDFQIVKDSVGVPGGASSVDLAVECFPGQSVVGGGAKSSGPPGTLSLRASHPHDTGDPGATPSNGWSARAFSTDPGAQTLKVFAICAD